MLYSGTLSGILRSMGCSNELRRLMGAGDRNVKHITSISKTPVLAESSTTDLTFILSILGLASDLFSLFLGSFSDVFSGLLTALGEFNSVKNPTTT